MDCPNRGVICTEAGAKCKVCGFGNPKISKRRANRIARRWQEEERQKAGTYWQYRLSNE